MMNKLFKVLCGGSMALALVSCGGGGDVAGDVEDFEVSPKEWKREVPPDANGSCSRAKGNPVTFTIIGGQPPFRIVNASPHGLTIDKTEATGKDPKFTVTPAGGCGDPFIITVLDYHSQVATVEVAVTIVEEDNAE